MSSNNKPCPEAHCLHPFESPEWDRLPEPARGVRVHPDEDLLIEARPTGYGKHLSPAFCCREGCLDIFLMARDYEVKAHGFAGAPRLIVRQ